MKKLVTTSWETSAARILRSIIAEVDAELGSGSSTGSIGGADSGNPVVLMHSSQEQGLTCGGGVLQ